MSDQQTTAASRGRAADWSGFMVTATVGALVVWAVVATDIHGAPLDLNRPDSTFMHHRGVLFATDEDLAGRLRELWRNRV